ncbi:hypothetical protein PMAYCL1PPCAC_18403, partial [Pristionchus mayeri]
EEEEEEEDPLREVAAALVSDVLEGLRGDEDGRSQSTRYFSATSHSASRADTNYDTCVTSQDDTFESAQGWTSQESEYQSAPSGVDSRASDVPSRAGSVTPQGATTPLAAVSPVASDRLAQAGWDEEGDSPIHRRFADLPSESVRSTPDVMLSMAIMEENEEDSFSPPPGQLLIAPSADPGRPVSPVPPRPGQRLIQEDDVPLSRESSQAAFNLNVEDDFELIEREEIPTVESLSESTPVSESRSEEESLRSYQRQSSDISSSSHADTVIPVDESRRETMEREIEETMEKESEERGSADSLDRVSLVSGGSGKRYSTSRKSSTSLKDEEKSEEKLTPEMEERRIVDEPMDEEMEEAEERPEAIESIELETVQEEAEDGESVNESGSSSNGGDTLQRLGKYKHPSSDNVSLTSLQEFERLEAKITGEGSLSGSDIELFGQGARRSMEGSHDSLAEFERLEEEVKKMSPQGEEVMMLSDIREESECEEMSTKGDDEEDVQSSEEMRVRPIDEDDRVGTPMASPDSIEGEFDKITDADIAAAEAAAYMEQSADSLELGATALRMEESMEDSSLAVHPEGRLAPPGEGALRDSLENVALSHDKDSLLEGGTSQEMFTSQDTHGMSGDTFHDDEVDSLSGEMTSAGGFPITLTTFETRRVSPDGSVETLSRRVQTRVTDPVSSHVQFTGTETEDQIKELEQMGVKETRDEEGNVTRTTYSKSHQ